MNNIITFTFDCAVFKNPSSSIIMSFDSNYFLFYCVSSAVSDSPLAQPQIRNIVTRSSHLDLKSRPTLSIKEIHVAKSNSAKRSGGDNSSEPYKDYSNLILKFV